MAGLELVITALLIQREGGAQSLETLDMGIHATASYLVTSGLAYGGMSQTCEQRSQKHDRSAQTGALGYEIHALGIPAVYLIGLECPAAGCGVLYVYAQLGEHVYEVPHIQYVRNVTYLHLIGGEQYGTKDLQDLVLGALRADGPFQSVTSFNQK